MKTKNNIKILFTLKQWLSSEVMGCLPTKDTDPERFTGKSFREECRAENKEKAELRKFIDGLKEKHKQNKKEIDEAYIKSKPDPFPELIEMPEIYSTTTDGKKVGILMRRIWGYVEQIENKDVYKTLLENNKLPCYTELMDRILSDRPEKIRFDYEFKEDPYINIFRHAILICPPSNVQSTVEYLKEQYEKINEIDSKKECKEKEEQLRYEFHKSLRQGDGLGNPHAEMIIWELLQFTDIPHRILKAVIKHTSKKQKQLA